jgi:hypothetical protein
MVYEKPVNNWKRFWFNRSLYKIHLMSLCLVSNVSRSCEKKSVHKITCVSVSYESGKNCLIELILRNVYVLFNLWKPTDYFTY